MGNYIKIYYGSFERLFGHLSDEDMEKELRKTLRHEFRHHLEGLPPQVATICRISIVIAVPISRTSVVPYRDNSRIR